MAANNTDMNKEVNRRATFDNLWPGNSPVIPDELAKDGFFATNRFLEVQCHFCQKRISDWQYNDLISVRHRRASPQCPMVLHPNNCANIARPVTEEPNAANVRNVDLKNELCRLATFKNWPNPNISPQSLAKAGFYYINVNDQVKCAWCKGVVARWEKNDNAFEVHQRFFPDCQRVQLGPLIQMATDGIRELGIQHICTPKRPKFACLHARLRTYTSWPITDIQNPQILSQAGFYYQEIDDQVRCFHCNGGLRSWQAEDDPWFEHAKWFPHCHFLKLVKGISYIAHVQETEHQAGAQETNPREALAENTETILSIDEAMASEPVQRALEMGLNEGRILNVTRRRLNCRGKPYETTEALVEAVLESQNNEEDDRNEPSSSSIVREVSRLLNTIFANNHEDDFEELENHHEDGSPAPSYSHNNYNRGGDSIEVGATAPPIPIQTTTAGSSHTTTTNTIEQQGQYSPNHSTYTQIRIRPHNNNITMDSFPLNPHSFHNNSNNSTSNASNSTLNSPQSTTTTDYYNPNRNQMNTNTTTSQTTTTAQTTPRSQSQPNNNQLNMNGRISSSSKSMSSYNSSTTTSSNLESENSSSVSDRLLLEEENRKLKDARQCKVCMDDEVGVVFLPCGHLVTCVQCAPGIELCPLCRTPIKGFVRTFLS